VTALGSVAFSTSGQTRHGQHLIAKECIGFRQKLSALVTEVALRQIQAVAARAEGTHPLTAVAAEFNTRGILVSASGAFHGKLLLFQQPARVVVYCCPYYLESRKSS